MNVRKIGLAPTILIVASLLAQFLFAGLPGTLAQSSTSVFINEIHYDNDGTDTGEAIEIAGPAGTDLTDWSIVLYNGSGGAYYDSDSLSGTIPNQENGFGTVSVSYSTNGMQNGAPDGVALVDDDDNVIQFLSYEGSFTATDGPADDMSSTNIGVSESSSTAVGDSLQLTGEGAVYEDFTWASASDETFDDVNTSQTFESQIPDVVINEVDADTSGTDTLEFVELYDGGDGNTDLDGLVVVFYNGNGDTSYSAFDLDSYSTDANGYFVLGNSGVSPTPDVTFSNNSLQNGADAVAVYAGDAADFPSSTALTTSDLVDAIVYDTDDADDAGLLALLNTGQPQVNEDGENDKDNDSNQRCPNGTGDALDTDTYIQSSATPGAANDCPVADVVINEVDADTSGTDTLEFVELYDGGDGNSDLDGLVVVFYNGNGDTSYSAFDLDGYSTDANGYFVLGNSGVSPTPDVTFSNNSLQNGADAVAVYEGDAADFPNSTALSTSDLVDAIVYDTDDADDAGLLALLNTGQPQVNEDGENDKDNDSNQRCPNGTGDKLDTDTYAQNTATPGASNDCPASVTSIYDIQYTTDASGDSPYKDQVGVTTEGIVVAIFSGGYFIEDSDGGAWNGLWVYDTTNTPSLGDLVQVTGTVIEYYNFTELGTLTDYELVSSGNSLPSPEDLSTTAVSQEQWESVLVRVENVTVTNASLGYGEWSVSDGSGNVAIDDKGSYTYAPTLNDTLDAITGTVDYSYSAFKIQPRDNDDLGIYIAPPTSTTIMSIQGTGTSSPLDGDYVTVSGVVLGFFEGNSISGNYDGFYIQDPDGDSNSNTSDGVFVNHGSLSISVSEGDVVTVTGRVQEYNEYDDPPPDTETQILVSSASDVITSGTDSITAINLAPDGTTAYFEAREGMLVTLPVAAYPAPVVAPTSYGAFFVLRGDESEERVIRNSSEDGKAFSVRYYARYGSGGPNFIVGSTISDGIEGPLAYSYGNYAVSLQSLASLSYIAADPPSTVPSWDEATSDELTVASFNTYNFESTGTPLTKVAAAIDALGGPLLLGLQEIDVGAVITDLLDELDTAGYSYDYAYSHPDVGGHGVALLWRTDRVSNVDWSTYQGCSSYGSSSSTAYDDYCDGTGQYPLFSRRPVVATATVTVSNTTTEVIMIANHFKSKLGGAAGDQRRLEQAELVADLVDDFIAADANANIVVVGDLNDYEDAAPLEALYASDNLTNTWYTLSASARYSYIYRGTSQVLDHVLVSPALSDRLDAVSPLHIDADFPYDPYHTNSAVIWRTSDHDPVAATFDFQ